AFERAAEDRDDTNGQWPVTIVALRNAMDNFYDKNQVGTKVTMGGLVGSPILRYLSGPPDVDVAIYIRPDLLAGKCSVELWDDNSQLVKQIPGCPSLDIPLTIKAGIYRLLVESDHITATPYRSPSKFLNQRAATWPHDLTSRVAAGVS